jgi:hypothetical protein
MSPVQWLAIGAGVVLLGTVLELVRRRTLTEEYSLVWIGCALAVLFVSLQRDWLDAAALRMGIYYPPALLLLALGAFVFLIALVFSVALSRQRRQIERLAEEVAILDARLRRAGRQDSAFAVTPGEVIADAAAQGGESRPERHVPGTQHVGPGQRQH